MRARHVRPVARAAAVWLVLVASASAQTPQQPQQPPAAFSKTLGAIQGVISTQDGSVRLPGATVTISAVTGEQVDSVGSDGEGNFLVAMIPPGTYKAVAGLMGFKSIETSVEVSAGRITPANFDLPLADLSEHVEVKAPLLQEGAMNETIAPTSGVTGNELDQFSPSTGVPGALRLLASVILTPAGVSIKGGRPNQTGLQLGPTTIVEPSTGFSYLTLPADAIASVDVLPNPYAVEFGRFSAGVVVVETRRAADKWSFRFNDFDPDFRTARDNPFVITGVQEFSPRIETGGSLFNHRLFLEQTAYYKYATNEVASLPENILSTDHQFIALTRADINLTPRHLFTAMGGPYSLNRSDETLGTFTPPNATIRLTDKLWHLNASEHATWSDKLLSDLTFRTQSGSQTGSPRGIEPMELLPETTNGNFYNRQERVTAIHQMIGTVSSSYEGPFGTRHLMKVGFDLLHTEYDGSSESRTVLIERTDGTVVRRLDYGGPSSQHADGNDLALFAQDRIQVGPRVYIEAGGRVDRDAIPDTWNFSPRGGAAVLLDGAGNIVVRGGIGVFFERTPSVAAAFQQFETPTETRFEDDGVTPLGPPVPIHYVTAPDLDTARSTAWNVSYEHRVNASWSFHASVLARQGSHELMLTPAKTTAGSELLLNSDGASIYRDVEIGAHFTHAPGFDITATYVRSSSRGDLNPFTSFFGTVMDPIVGENGYGPTSADAPNRVLVRGRLSTAKWLFLEVFDWRSGFPYSVVNEYLDFVGTRNSLRFPDAVHVELGAQRRLKVMRFRPWLGLRIDNPFNNFSPTDVQANISSPQFGSFYNPELRRYRIIIRFAR